MTNSTIQVRDVNTNTKNKANQVFQQMGISMSGAIKMFINQVAVTQEIPFEPKTLTKNGLTPEQEDRILEIANSDDFEVFESAEELIKDLHKNKA